MLELFRLLDRVTDTALPVVIQGESGTGKELVARAIHFNGPRRERPFVSENCAAIPETLLESTLFGHVRGAFTGAEHDTRGLFEVADGGTLFLDEVGEMSPGMQGKLLRVLQDGEFRRVGSERTRKVDVRIIAASNRDLARMVEEGKFREDLVLPPQRRAHLPAAAARAPRGHPAHRRAPRWPSTPGRRCAAARVPKPIDPEALARLIDYRWPGNVRELENEIMRATALSGERITVADLSPQVAARGDGAAGRRRGSRQPVPAAARRAAGALADPRGAGPVRQQPDQGRGGAGVVALRAAEEAAAVQLCLTAARPHNQVGRIANQVDGAMPPETAARSLRPGCSGSKIAQL